MNGICGLSDEERRVVRQCLHAAVHGPFFPDWEFHTLFGLDRPEAAVALSRWPDLQDSRESHPDHLLINNAFANLLYYPHDCETRWPEFIQASVDEVARVFAKWRGHPPANYFEAVS